MESVELAIGLVAILAVLFAFLIWLLYHEIFMARDDVRRLHRDAERKMDGFHREAREDMAALRREADRNAADLHRRMDRMESLLKASTGHR